MNRLLFISAILAGSSVSVLSQEIQKELPIGYSRLPLELQSYDVTEDGEDIECFSSYTLWENDGHEYLLPGKENHLALFCNLERHAISEQRYNQISSFDQWIEQYHGIYLNRASFDFTDEWEYSFSSPINALRSYWHALNNCDPEIVLNYSDPSFVNHLEHDMKQSLLASPPIFNNEGRTKITPLLTGASVTGGKEYTMLFYRRECPHDPKSNRIGFHWDFFVHLNGTYYLSYAPASSQFGNMVKAMNLGYVYPAGKYDYLVERLEETSMPKDFFTLKD